MCCWDGHSLAGRRFEWPQAGRLLIACRQLCKLDTLAAAAARLGMHVLVEVRPRLAGQSRVGGRGEQAAQLEQGSRRAAQPRTPEAVHTGPASLSTYGGAKAEAATPRWAHSWRKRCRQQNSSVQVRGALGCVWQQGRAAPRRRMASRCAYLLPVHDGCKVALAQEADEQEEGAHAEHGGQGEGAHLQPAGRGGRARRLLAGSPPPTEEAGCTPLSCPESYRAAAAGAALGLVPSPGRCCAPAEVLPRQAAWPPLLQPPCRARGGFAPSSAAADQPRLSCAETPAAAPAAALPRQGGAASAAAAPPRTAGRSASCTACPQAASCRSL